MRMFTALLLVLLSLTASGQEAEGSADQQTARFNQWLDARYEEELAFHPMDLTELGRREGYDQIDDYSEAALDKEFRWLAQSVVQMAREFEYESLTSEGQISYDFWLYRYEREKAALPFRRNEYIFDQFESRHTWFPTFLINYHEVDSEADMQAYIARIRGSARALGQLLERAQVAAKEGVRPPRFAYHYVIDQSRRLISGAPFEREAVTDASLWMDAKAKIAGLQERGAIDSARAEALRNAAALALTESLLPAYTQLIQWMEADLSNTDEQPQGASSLPNGEAYYASKVAAYTTTGMSAAQVHALGLAEVARILAEMEAIKAQVGFKGTMAEFFEFVRVDQQFYYPNTDAGRLAYIAETGALLETMNARLPAYFGILPKASLEVRRVEAFREEAGAAAFYNSGTPDGARPGVYYLHLADMAAMSTIDLETTAYHEGNPGHHMQSSIALELTSLPLFRTNVWYSAYGEGWALYSEYLAKEMGAFEKPYSDFGRLVNEMWRAIRLVVDTGVHAKGWSEQRAVDYMMANSSIPETTVRSEIHRYIVAPGQAVSYKVGMLKIQALREQASQALGKDFDIRGFHDTILSGGSLPLEILSRRIDDWVATVKRGKAGG